jgi:hypothetical protein
LQPLRRRSEILFLSDATGGVAQQDPFNPNTAWERLDDVETKFTLRYFEDRYTQKLRIELRRVAGEAAVYMAMHGVPPPLAPVQETELAKIPEGAKVSVSTDEGPSTVPLNALPRVVKTVSVKSDPVREGLRKAAKAMREKTPGISDLQISKALEGKNVAGGLRWETIRKKIR